MKKSISILAFLVLLVGCGQHASNSPAAVTTRRSLPSGTTYALPYWLATATSCGAGAGQTVVVALETVPQGGDRWLFQARAMKGDVLAYVSDPQGIYRPIPLGRALLGDSCQGKPSSSGKQWRLDGLTLGEVDELPHHQAVVLDPGNLQ